MNSSSLRPRATCRAFGKLFLGCSLVGLLALPLLAGQPQADAKVKFPTGNASWSVDLQVEGKVLPGSTAGKTKKKISITREGEFRRDLITWSDGSTTQLWWSEKSGMAVWESEPNGRVSGRRANQLSQERYDEQSFDWIAQAGKPANKIFDSRVCDYYECIQPEGEDGHVKLRAWVDAATRLPVALDSGSGIIGVFSFAKKDPAPLDIPARFWEKFKQYDRSEEPPKAN